MTSVLSDQEQQRYLRQIQLPECAIEGQVSLKNSHVLIVGMGGLGCPASLYLAAAGVGKLTLIDGDVVSLSNLQRQVLYTEAEIGINKAQAAAKRLGQLNSDIDIVAVTEHFSLKLGLTLLAGVDLVIDCTDNFQTRYLINDLCHHFQLPWIYSSVLRMVGQMALFKPGGACFRCLFPELTNTPDCNAAGVLGPLPGMMGTLQASEAIKFLVSDSPSSQYPFIQIDAVGFNITKFNLTQSSDCAVCSGNKTYRDLQQDYPSSSSSLDEALVVSKEHFEQLLNENNNSVLIDVRSTQEHQQNNIGGISLPLDQLDTSQQLDKSSIYLIYCQTGKRSRLASEKLHELGYAVYALEGGIEQY